jgi:hypothetical protein
MACALPLRQRTHGKGRPSSSGAHEKLWLRFQQDAEGKDGEAFQPRESTLRQSTGGLASEFSKGRGIFPFPLGLQVRLRELGRSQRSFFGKWSNFLRLQGTGSIYPT